jgi:predicted dehydrogenase
MTTSIGLPNRRRFVGTALATAASYGRILGANDRIRIGAIGIGARGQYLLGLLKQLELTEIAAVCDVYEPHVNAAKAQYAPDARGCVDHRELLGRNDIDAVVIGTPDHWHVPIVLDAIRAGKDIYCEKPITHTIEEGEPVIAAVRESKRVLQTGLQQRSWEHFAQAREEILGGRLGQVTLIRTYWYQNHIPAQGRAPSFETGKLDWKRFLGSASSRPFDADQYANWRWYWDFGGGAMTDLFVHWVDVAHWIMGTDAPSRATANGLTAILTQRQTPDTMSAALAYPGHAMVEFDCALLGYLEGGGLMIRGTKAAMRIWRGGFSVYAEVPRYTERPDPSSPVLDVKSNGDRTVDHMKNFLDCVRSRNTPNAPVEVGVAAARAGHVANFALRGNGVWNQGDGRE